MPGLHLVLTPLKYRVWSVAFSPNGKQVVSGSFDKSVKLWNVETGTELSTMSGHSHNVSCLAFKPDDPNILVSGSWDKTLKIWDLSTAACLSTVNVDSEVKSVAFSPCGKTIAAGCWNAKVVIVDVATVAVMRSLSGHSDW